MKWILSKYLSCKVANWFPCISLFLYKSRITLPKRLNEWKAIGYRKVILTTLKHICILYDMVLRQWLVSELMLLVRTNFSLCPAGCIQITDNGLSLHRNSYLDCLRGRVTACCWCCGCCCCCCVAKLKYLFMNQWVSDWWDESWSPKLSTQLSRSVYPALWHVQTCSLIVL